MSTIVCNLNSIIASCDTLVVKFDKLREILQPIVKEAETNDKDLWMVGIVCVTIVLVAIIAAAVVLLWKYIGFIAAKNERDHKKTKEKEESTRKQQSDLLEKLLSFKLKCNEYMVNKDGKRIDKDDHLLMIDENAKDDYDSLLRVLLKIHNPKANANQTPQQN